MYDFLYHDARRTQSFLGQIDPSGHLTALKQSETASKSEGEEGSVQTAANLAVAKAVGTTKRMRGSGGGEAVERTYDPFWANALEFRDYLLKHDLLRFDLEGARIGQFVLVTGALTVMDLTLFKGLWQLPAVRDAMLAGAATAPPAQEPRNRQERRVAAHRGGKPQPPPAASETERTLEGGLALIGMLPHAIQARIAVSAEGPVVWTSLREEGLVVSAADLILKHGAAVAGEWSMLGVLDAFPDLDADGNLTPSGVEGALSALSLSDSPFGQVMYQMMP
ncbi:MAG: hypothetical protein AVDCRST_MAG31-505 [uncultured Sphingomonas sp.]|uniref:Uncharacterized protein n=1 Tax=uncultured Sphingomonas sp. TaxID=158754 RepID=A0A6J4SR67_9SPHN|nr:hypothetical protein [uncultured Sphingomonas sp.]CAA9503074.1 MAG: hypothetical protein AVDCRST_MAG31-505 [uncultured Sphingomonas sp.]